MWRSVFVAALCLSVTANAYLWFTRPTGEARTRAAEGERETRLATRAPTLPKLEALPDPATQAQPYADIERSALEQRVLTTESRIADLLPAEEKFARDARSTETEATVKPYLDRIFKAQPGADAPYRVECHGLVCKLQTKRPRDEWQGPLQTTFPEAGWFCGMTFSHETYIELCKPEMLGASLHSGITIAFRSSEQAHACVADRSARGDLTLSIRLDPASRKLSSEADGSLAAHPVGLCLRKALDEVLARTRVPPGLTSFPEQPIVLQLPDDPR